MLDITPKFSIINANEIVDKLDVFMMLDCDSGPTELTRVTNLSEFYLLYQSNLITKSYQIAIYLLKLGYSLSIKRVREVNNRSSLLLSTKGYSYPKYSYEYVPFNSLDYENTDANLNYACTISINKDLDTENDYVLFNISRSVNINRDIWYCLLLGLKTVEDKPIEDSLSTITLSYQSIIGHSPLEDDPKTFANNLAKIIMQNIGFYAEVIDPTNSEDYYKIEVSSNYLFRLPISTFDVDVDVNKNYDISCKYLWDTKTAVIYSKYDSTNAHIVVTVDTKGFNYIDGTRVLNYSMKVDKYDVNDEYIIGTETYEWNTSANIDELSELINYQSKLIEIKLFSAEISTGTFRLNRIVEMVESTSDDFTRGLTSITKINSEILIDSGVDDPEFISTLLNRSTVRNLALIKYHEDLDYNRLSISVFGDYFNDKSTIDYPSYLLYLYLLSTGRNEGYIDADYSYDITESTSEMISINHLSTDNYNTKLINPQGYYVGRQIALDNLISIIVLINKLITKIASTPSITTNDVPAIVQEVVNTYDNYLVDDIDLIVISATIINRNCNLVLQVSINDYSSTKFPVNININVVS